MIKRNYFFAARWNYKDGTFSFSFGSYIFSRKSLFSQHNGVYEEALKTAKEDFIKNSGVENGCLEVISFNRI